MTNEDKQQLQVIALKKAGEITPEDRELLKRAGDELGIKVKNTRCKSCWQDMAIECALKVREREPKQEAEPERKYVLKKGVDVLFGYPHGIRVNELTLTDELAEKLIAKGFSKNFFEKCE